MDTQANTIIGPYTNFEELYTFKTCPTRLFLKLIGAKSEIERRYTPPSINPQLLGKIGEDRIKNNFMQERKVLVPEVKSKGIEFSLKGFERKFKQLKLSIENNEKILFSQIKKVKVESEPLVITDEGLKLKREYGIEAIIQTLDYTTIPHHLVGKIDFVGLREDRSIVVIETKNKEKVGKKDIFQLEYYLHGISKQYNFNKFYKHSIEIISQLYPSDYEKSLKLSKIYDLITDEKWTSYELVHGFISSLNENELEKIRSIYHEYNTIDLINSVLSGLESYQRIIKKEREVSEKLSNLNKTINDNVSFLNDLSTKDIREGLLIDLKKSKISEVDLHTDFDLLTRGVWNLKHNIANAINKAPKVLTACNSCSFRNACRTKMIDEGLKESRSMTSIVHRGFYDNNLLRGESDPMSMPWIFSVPLGTQNNTPEVLMSKFQSVKIDSLLEKSLEKTSWPYSEGLLKKRGWKSLYADSLASKKITKEFEFWHI